MCGRYVVTNPVSKTDKLVKSAIQVDDNENYNAHPYQKPIATPADWQVGQDVIVALSLNDEQAKEKYGELDVKLPYLRTVKS